MSSGQPETPAETQSIVGAVAGRVTRRLGGRVVSGERADAGVVGVDRVEEVLAPGVGARHADQVLDVDGGQHRPAGLEALAAVGLDPDAAAVAHDQASDAPVTEHLAAVRLDHRHERSGELARSAARERPAAALAPEDDRVGERPGAGGLPTGWPV